MNLLLTLLVVGVWVLVILGAHRVIEWWEDRK